MPLTRLDNLYSSKTGKYLYVSPDDFNATDELDNRGNSPLRPFKTIQRAFIEVARYSYLPGKDNDRFDQFSIMLMPGNHFIDNRPGLVDTANPESRFFDAGNLIEANKQTIIDRAAAEIFVHMSIFQTVTLKMRLYTFHHYSLPFDLSRRRIILLAVRISARSREENYLIYS